MEIYAKDNHLKLILNTAFISLTLTFFNSQTNIYFVVFLVEVKKHGVQGSMSPYDAIKKQNKTTQYILYIYNSILFSK